eukprot:CAMPEP_0196581788 /NCGR_PEP_ID=MMETSP1081-20130531/35584_1 /TAXON_ID=36882 /ORGANISM="Pyramimonas amylifera, Strain CCMP720" /LENGTH=187 /DNA_ID=CAMNT_0041902139 /DNA_START=95 /DNA_END=654 /DNA_ORIENTATION=-
MQKYPFMQRLDVVRGSFISVPAFQRVCLPKLKLGAAQLGRRRCQAPMLATATSQGNSKNGNGVDQLSTQLNAMPALSLNTTLPSPFLENNDSNTGKDVMDMTDAGGSNWLSRDLALDKTQAQRGQTQPRKTKIVCTIGPSSCERDVLFALADAGMNVARINMSHGDHISHKKVIDLVKEYNASGRRG